MAASEGQVLIDGRWREAVGGSLPVVNPSDGETFAEIARGGAEEVNEAVEAARRALEGDWGRMPAFERGRVLVRLSQLISDRVEELAALEARDVGKPLRQARADALALARYFEFYGGAADKVIRRRKRISPSFTLKAAGSQRIRLRRRTGSAKPPIKATRSRNSIWVFFTKPAAV